MKTRIPVLSAMAIGALALGAFVLFSQCSKQSSGPRMEEMKAMDHEAMPAEGQTIVKQTLASPEVKVGEWTVCPVMRTKFQVKEDSLFAEVNGKKVYVCCAGCPEILKANPKKYL